MSGRATRLLAALVVAQRVMPPEPPIDGDPLAPHSLSPAEIKSLLVAEGAGYAFLAFRDEQGRLRFFAAGERGENSTVGRREETDLSLPWDTSVSALHAELHHIGGEWTIVDDGLSTNGTYLNGERISGRQRLRDGDRIRVGHTVLVYRAAQGGPAGQTVSAGDPLAVDLTDTQRRVLIALCRPFREGSFGSPATNQAIAGELFLSVDAVKMHLRTLFGKFELGHLPQNLKRAKLAESALQSGVISRRDLG